MKMELSVTEVVDVFKEIQRQPRKIFEMIRLDVRELVGRYLSEVMKAELTHFWGREPYERNGQRPNYRNGSYSRRFALKGIGEVHVNVPRNRRGEYQTQVLPRCQQYENEIGKDFLWEVSRMDLSEIRRFSRREISIAIPFLPLLLLGWNCTGGQTP